MPPDVADHVAAVVLLGKPGPKFMEAIDTPQVEIGALYAAKTIDLCIANDPICSGTGDGANHSLYNKNGMTDQAATFAVGSSTESPRCKTRRCVWSLEGIDTVTERYLSAHHRPQ